ncbi:mycofactocin-coupled SDR family oxidoreductase [Hoyosella subflava]|uniref:Short-chain dehydrogenase/reductase SDR n=1 Tax=Hoyosella subflava (strain DSM 45089 / JCM 17490 / NBRC 109087 / DQS3-9A1) TaxID=443218 RepID=F6EM19_HOYSD|nr:mycofactocin-coupled SDR family oxidoreductase [Hoyosella subflava]AEF42800.1 Short-chain dehydrogenase/reductase SDR [Hoyosella subflava DQS3-9A1]
MNDGTVALVTGAARGMGAATVHALAAQGYRVLAVDSCAGDGPARPHEVKYALASASELLAVAEKYDDAQVQPHIADVRDRKAMEHAAAAAVTAFGQLDVAVAAAGVIAGGQPLWETSNAELHGMWETNLVGVWNTAAACVPHMLTGPDPSRCRFVAVSSAAGTHGLYHLAAYSASKHAVVGLVKGLAADLAGTGVTAAAVAPGATQTDMLEGTARLYGLTTSEDLGKSALIRRLLAPEDLAGVIALCCSREGAALNGSVVSADGGFRP